MNKSYSLICKHTGEVRGNVFIDEANAAHYESEDITVIEGKCCFRSQYRRADGSLAARVPADISADVEVCLPGDTITITKPADCKLRVGDQITGETTFIAGPRDFRAACVGRYTGEVHVVVRSEEQVREAALKDAMEAWFREHAEGKKVLQAPVRSLSQKVRQRLKS